ncbi:hypothetical protein A0256_23990 [Mucilaginibacter sp. PAMC 26640]|nr:hypothetical protein A0256_23990 [Mucilaginibacter sp. PAMC 26640]
MNLQYISDSAGETTGVFIPINEWNELKDRYKDLEEEEVSIPQWHVDIVRDRLNVHETNPNEIIDFRKAMADLAKEF